MSTPATSPEVLEALRSAQDFFAFLWNGMCDETGNGGRIALTCDDELAATLANMMTDAQNRIDNALAGLETPPAADDYLANARKR